MRALLGDPIKLMVGALALLVVGVLYMHFFMKPKKIIATASQEADMLTDLEQEIKDESPPGYQDINDNPPGAQVKEVIQEKGQVADAQGEQYVRGPDGCDVYL